ncbi:MAG: ATP-dependent zinc metalloprotease FtsH [Rickettsiales bacterium]|jgi:cell division protease FtsH|nr:ATP-dependent zinc metalloprotease FtsH [Rickettsiales bacterium]
MQKNKNEKKFHEMFPTPKLPKWLLFVLIMSFAFGISNLYETLKGNTENQKPVKELMYSELLGHIKKSEIKNIVIEENQASGELVSGDKFKSTVALTDEFFSTLNSSKSQVEIKNPSAFNMSFITNLIWIIFIGIIFFSMTRGMKGDKFAGMIKLRLKMAGGDKKITFKNVAGINEAKEDLEEIVDFLKTPKKFTKIGGRIPKGVLLVGPPGTGKTLLAKAIAGEADVPFFTISGSDFVEMFVGVGASRVRALFEQGKRSAPCIIFIDEIDAVGRHRGVGYGGGNDEREQTLNQLLVEMDGFESNDGVVIIAATNRADVLDDALLRPGRFDRQIYVPLPDLKGREEILRIHSTKVKMLDNINLDSIARGTPGFSGAELANLINESALLAARRNHSAVDQNDLEDTRDKIMMGAERKSMTMRPEEIKMTAYHEAGHAICALKIQHTDPIHKATIIPRGEALGMVQRLPTHDKVSLSIAEVRANIVIAFGGRVAEDIFFGSDKITAGASSDIKYATHMARSSVAKWGFSKKLGPIYFEESALGYHTSTERKNISDDTAKAIDSEVAKMIDDGISETTRIIKKYKSETEKIANALIEFETLTGEELQAIVNGTFKKTKPVKVITEKIVAAKKIVKKAKK